MNVLLIVDGTGSMDAVFPMVCRAVRDMSKIASVVSDREVKFGLITYRDWNFPRDAEPTGHGHGWRGRRPYRSCIQEYPFQSAGALMELATRDSFVPYGGGGDGPEASKYAFFLGMEMIETARASGDHAEVLVLHFGDDLPHGIRVGPKNAYRDQAPHRVISRDSIRGHVSNYYFNELSKENIGRDIPWTEFCTMFLERTGAVVVNFIFRARLYRDGVYRGGNTTHRDTVNVWSRMGLVISGHANTLTISDFHAIAYDLMGVTPRNDRKVLDGVRDEVSMRTCVPSMSACENGIVGIKERFERSPEYRLVCERFMLDNLEDGGNGRNDGFRLFVSNPIIGSIWRVMCSSPSWDAAPIALRLSKECQTSPVLQKWVLDSYDRSDEINRVMSEFSNEIRVVMSEPCNLPKKDVMELGRSFYNVSVFSSLVSKMTVVHVSPDTKSDDNVDTKISDESADFVSMDLPDNLFFKYLGHIFSHGFMLRKMGAVGMALMCLKTLPSDSQLHERALSYLTSIRGTWCSDANPSIFTHGFVRIALPCVALGIFTDEETKLLHNLHLFFAARIAGSNDVVIQTSAGFDVYPDGDDERKVFSGKPGHSFLCGVCQKECHVSVFCVETGVCGKCTIQAASQGERPMGSASSFDPSKFGENTFLHLSCHDCQCRYATHGMDSVLWDRTSVPVNVRCHWCRYPHYTNEKKTVRCVNCLADCIDPLAESYDRLGDGLVSKYLCDICETDPHAHEISVNRTIRDLLRSLDIALVSRERIPLRFVSLGPLTGSVLGRVNVFTTLSAYKTLVNPQNYAELIPNPGMHQLSASGPGSTMGTTIPVFNADEIAATVAMYLANPKPKLVECALCCDDVPIERSSQACGNCHNFLCNPCAKGWYGNSEIGSIVLPTHLQCPFCKQTPKYKVVKSVNSQLCHIRKTVFDPTQYHLWCRSCRNVKPFCDKVCAEGIPELKDHECFECKARRDTFDDSTYMRCPGCNTPTVKNGGCNHITCVCGAHWCYMCGFRGGTDGIGIYDHLGSECALYD